MIFLSIAHARRDVLGIFTKKRRKWHVRFWGKYRIIRVLAWFYRVWDAVLTWFA
jgi:hypothetical protein